MHGITLTILSLSVSRPEYSNEIAQFVNIRIDWKETPGARVFKVDLLGINKEELKVEVEDGRVLQISGERNKEKEEKNDQWHRIERSSAKFLCQFQLPENAKVDEVRAAMENRVLTVTVPKVQEVKKPEGTDNLHRKKRKSNAKISWRRGGAGLRVSDGLVS
ncbi:Alpha crystallin/Hsp20 domain [Macleaya cordata]|uniref:Alpha crystallin/Hsp20 domain n=1 Tax=Macleaya cordata TaxID=56857 RepID=A0A200QY02_MACCD|nr:Alpha crystallin/Hsp20 domain [Macleaya cordata]